MKKIYLFIASLALYLPALAFAKSVASDAHFEAFANTVMGWTSGPLGTGLAIVMMVMGMALGIANNSPMPAIASMAGSFFLHFGPGIIMSMTMPSGNAPVEVRPTTVQVVAAAPEGASASVANASVAPVATLSLSAASAPLSSAATTPRSSASQSPSLSHTVPVPTAVQPHVTLKAPAVSSSQVTKWVGLGGAAIVLSLLGLLMYLSTQRRSRSAGANPGGASAAPSVFSDPHGFKREKRSPSFGHEST